MLRLSVLAIAVLALIVAGCGSGSDNAGTDQSGSDGSETVSAKDLAKEIRADFEQAGAPPIFARCVEAQLSKHLNDQQLQKFLASESHPEDLPAPIRKPFENAGENCTLKLVTSGKYTPAQAHRLLVRIERNL